MLSLSHLMLFGSLSPCGDFVRLVRFWQTVVKIPNREFFLAPVAIVLALRGFRLWAL